MNKFLHMDKSNFLYSTLIISLFAIIFFSLTSCGASFEEMKKERSNNSEQVTIGSKYNEEFVSEYEYKGHTYIIVGGGNSKWGSHAGHCRCNNNAITETTNK